MVPEKNKDPAPGRERHGPHSSASPRATRTLTPRAAPAPAAPHPRRARPAAWCARRRSARRSSSRRARPAAWQSASRATSTCAESAGKPAESSQTCRSWTSTTPGLSRQRVPDLLRVEAGRGSLQEDPPRGAQQADGGAQHQRGHQQRGDRVGALEAGQQDHGPRERRADEREQVGEDVLEGALDAHVRLAPRARERGGGGAVDRDPRQRHPTIVHAETVGGEISRPTAE